MNKYKLILIALLFFLSLHVHPQTSEVYQITLKENKISPGNGSLVELKVSENYSFLKNIPDIECDLSAINYFKMNQFIFKDSIPNQIYLFVGVNEQKKEKYIVVDVNNNHDFSDDQLFTIPIPDTLLTYEEKMERAFGLEIALKTENNEVAHIGIDPFNILSYKYGLKQDPRLEVVIGFGDNMETKAQLNDIPIEITTYVPYNLFEKKLNDKTEFSIKYEDGNGELKSRSFFKRDTLHIGDKLFKINKIEHPDIYFEEIGTLTDSSRVWAFLPDAYVKDIETHENIHLNELVKGKYTFIDFWGSWCGPCIKAMPKLKEMHDKVKDRNDVLIIGIASEQTDDTKALKKVIQNKGIEWLNVWETPKGGQLQNSILKKLHINIYPSYIILDKSGKIIYRGDASIKTEEIMDFFLDTIKE